MVCETCSAGGAQVHLSPRTAYRIGNLSLEPSVRQDNRESESSSASLQSNRELISDNYSSRSACTG
jgi:hypothetical protein